jgi:hypothetical protein
MLTGGLLVAEGSLLLALYGWMESGASPPYTRQNDMKLCCPARFFGGCSLLRF